MVVVFPEPFTPTIRMTVGFSVKFRTGGWSNLDSNSFFNTICNPAAHHPGGLPLRPGRRYSLGGAIRDSHGTMGMDAARDARQAA